MRITCVCVYAIVIVLAMVHKTFEILSLFFLDISLQDICNVPKNIILYVDSTRFVLVAYTQFLDTLDIRRLSCIHHHAHLMLAHTHTHIHTPHTHTIRRVETSNDISQKAECFQVIYFIDFCVFYSI